MRIPAVFFFLLFISANMLSQSPNWIYWNYTNSDLPSPYIYIVSPDSSGNIFTSDMDSPIYRFDGNRTWAEIISNSAITDAHVDSDGVVWALTSSGRISRIANDTARYLDDTIFSDNGIYHVEALSVDRHGVKWFLTDKYLIKYNNTSRTRYLLPPDGFYSSINVKSNSESDKKDDNPLGNSHDPMYRRYSMAFDSNGYVWIGTFGRGVWKFDGYYWAVYNKQYSGLRSDTITAIEVDKHNNVWAGIISDTKFTFFGPANDNGCIAKFDGVTWTEYDYMNSVLPGEGLRVSALAADPSGTIYAAFSNYTDLMGTDNRVFYKHYNNTWMKIPIGYEYTSSYTFPSVHALRIDKNGTKWLGTSAGLAAYNEEGIDGITQPYKPPTFRFSAESGYKSIRLSWAYDPAGGLTYRIYRRNSSEQKFRLIASDIRDSVYYDSDLSADSSYYYKVQSYDELAGAESRNTNSELGKLIVIPVSPTDVKLLCNDNGNLLQWRDSETKYFNKKIYYRIYRSTSPDGGFIRVKDSVYTNYYLDNTAKADVRYYYDIKTYFPESFRESVQAFSLPAYKLPVDILDNWKIKYVSDLMTFNSACAPDKNSCWVVGSNGTILYTKNKGETQGNWFKSELDTNLIVKNSNLRQVYFTNSDRGWIVGGNDESIITNQGGIVLHTGDGGDSWQIALREKQYYFNTIFFKSQLEGYIGGHNITNRNAIMLHTIDGGLSWEPISFDNLGSFLKIQFFNDQYGAAVFKKKSSDSLSILLTTNGGNTWIYYPNDVCDFDFRYGTLIAIKSDGQILYSHDFTKTGLFNNSEYYNSNGVRMHTVTMADSLYGCAAGKGGQFLSTRDGGVTWQKQECNKTDDNISDICFYNGLLGYAVGSHTILRTLNGGRNDYVMLPPRDLSATNTSTNIRLRWKESPHSDYSKNIVYNVYRMKKTGAFFTKIAENLDLPVYKDSLVEHETEYIYYVYALIGNRTSDSTNHASGFLNIKPEPPTGLGGYIEGSAIKMYWDHSPTMNVTYKVLRSKRSGAGFAAIGDETGNNEFIDTAPLKNENYYVVQAKGNVTGLSSIYSDEFNILFTDINEGSTEFKTGIYPNPFSGTAFIRYNLNKTSFVKINICNSLGNTVAVPVMQTQEAGDYSVIINGEEYPSGSYYYTIFTTEGNITGSFNILH